MVDKNEGEKSYLSDLRERQSWATSYLPTYLYIERDDHHINTNPTITCSQSLPLLPFHPPCHIQLAMKMNGEGKKERKEERVCSYVERLFPDQIGQPVVRTYVVQADQGAVVVEWYVRTWKRRCFHQEMQTAKNFFLSFLLISSRVLSRSSSYV